MKKKNTVTMNNIMKAWEALEASGFPVKEFDPNARGGGCDFYFSRGLSPEEQKKAKEIVNKHFPNTWTFM